MASNANRYHQHPDGIIDPAMFDALMNGIAGGGAAAWNNGEFTFQDILDDGYTESEIVGDDQRWDLANSGTLSDNPQTHLFGLVGSQPSSAQDVALANDLSSPFGALPPAPPPDYNNYEGRRDLLAPWQYGNHLTAGFEESTIVPSDSNTHTRVPSSGSNSNSGTGSMLVKLGSVDGVAEHALGKDDNENSQVDKKEDKGKGRAVADTPPTPSNVEQWVGAIGTTMQVSPNQSATPPREFLGAGDFHNVDGSVLVGAGLTIPENSAVYRRRAVDAELAPPPFHMSGIYGGRSLPPVPPTNVARSHPATTTTGIEPSASAQHRSRTDAAPSAPPHATIAADPAPSSRKLQAPAPSSRKRKAAESGAGAPANKQSHHGEKPSRHDKKQSRSRRRKDPKTSAKKHRHAQQGSEYFTLTHSNWILRLPTEDGDAQTSPSSSGTSSSDEAQASAATASNDARTNAGSGDEAVQSEDAVTTQQAAWHNNRERPKQEQAPFRFWGERDSRRRAQYGLDMLARIERETAIAATSSSNLSRNGSAPRNASGSSSASPSSSDSLDVDPRGHGSRSLGDDRAQACDTRAGPDEAEPDLLATIAPTPASSDPAMRLPQDAVSAPLAQPAGSYEIPHNIATSYAYQQHAPPQHAPAGWYDYSCGMPRAYAVAPNPYMMPTAYHPPPPFSWPYFPPAGFHAASLNPSVNGHVNHYSDYEHGYPSTSVQQTHFHGSTPPLNNASYGEDGWYY
ncbi:uncharacterized protein SCHCODRAFT_02665086 [Schizophyllum commune H4-8]|nr:uncharacterized protein SCHCODRAFT_02665086 [Schizophyllum commune H4-8]KAI5894597.1 hypothetical protein SCHCODRAFT_02665086 [Schizophyllum commune H4-8]